MSIEPAFGALDGGGASLVRLDGEHTFGLPTVAALRPNARGFAVALAVREHAAEAAVVAMRRAVAFARAEDHDLSLRLEPVAHKQRDGIAIPPHRCDPADVRADGALVAWVRGTDAMTGQDVWVPVDYVQARTTVAETALLGLRAPPREGLAVAREAAEAEELALRSLARVIHGPATPWQPLPRDVVPKLASAALKAHHATVQAFVHRVGPDFVRVALCIGEHEGIGLGASLAEATRDAVFSLAEARARAAHVVDAGSHHERPSVASVAAGARSRPDPADPSAGDEAHRGTREQLIHLLHTQGVERLVRVVLLPKSDDRSADLSAVRLLPIFEDPTEASR